jgi:hypothetical protein
MGKSDMSVVFPPSPLSRSEHSEAQLWHIVCFHTSLLAKDMHKPGRRFQISFRFFLCQSSCSNFGMQRTFQASSQTLFDARFRLNSHKIPTSFPLWYPNIRTYTVTCSSQLRWISGFSLYTLYSSEQFALCSYSLQSTDSNWLNALFNPECVCF